MANTSNKAVRIDDRLWKAGKAKAAEEGRPLTSALEEFLSEWTGVPRIERPTGRPANNSQEV